MDRGKAGQVCYFPFHIPPTPIRVPHPTPFTPPPMPPPLVHFFPLASPPAFPSSPLFYFPSPTSPPPYTSEPCCIAGQPTGDRRRGWGPTCFETRMGPFEKKEKKNNGPASDPPDANNMLTARFERCRFGPLRLVAE